MKKVLSIVMALALVLALAVPAFAVEVPNAEVIASFEGPKTATNWWFDAWLDGEQKSELMTALYNGSANYIVVVFEGDATNSYQIGSQDTTAWTNDLFHFNYPAEGQIATADKAELIDGYTYIYLSASTYLDYIAALGYDYSAGTGFNWIIGAPGETPLVGMYAVKAEITVEEPVDDTPAVEETPAEDTTTEAPAEETEEPADTGLALAVVPMIVAAAAVALSKKR